MNYAKLLNLRQQKLKREKQYDGTVDLDKLIIRLKLMPVKRQMARVYVTEKQFIMVCRMVRNVTLNQPSLLKLQNPLVVATGTVGYYQQLCHIFFKCGKIIEIFNYLFLGDYTGKGPASIECLLLLFCYKVKFKNNFFLLRGCYESLALARSYNLYQECQNRFSSKAWTEACEALCSLPYAAVISEQIFCVHGGISPSLEFVEQINKLPRPLDTPEVGLPCDLVWSDPSYKLDSLMWTQNQRGFSYSFNHEAVEKFLSANSLRLICRSHQIAFNGFEFNSEKTCVTINSLANYGGLYNNSAGIMNVDFHGCLYFKIIKQRQYFPFERYIKETVEQYLLKISKKKRQGRQRIAAIKTKEEEEMKSLLAEHSKWEREYLEELKYQEEMKKLEGNQEGQPQLEQLKEEQIKDESVVDDEDQQEEIIEKAELDRPLSLFIGDDDDDHYGKGQATQYMMHLEKRINTNQNRNEEESQDDDAL